MPFVMKLLSLVISALLVAGVSPAQTFTLLHAFTGGADGNRPQTGMALGGNTLYGTTFYGANVFRINTDGTGFGVVRSSAGASWYNPNEVILGGNTLYVTTESGSIFKVDTDGNNYSVIKNFNTSDGSTLQAGLLLKDATLYGTAASGGSNGSGTVFKMGTDGSGFAVLYNFTDSHSNNLDRYFP